MPSEKLIIALDRPRKDSCDSMASDNQTTATIRKHPFSLKPLFSRLQKAQCKGGATETQDSNPGNEGDKFDENFALAQYHNSLGTEHQSSAWIKHWEAVDRGAHIGTSNGRGRLSFHLSGKAVIDKLDLNELKTTAVRIPRDWFRPGMDFFRRKDGECESAADDRFPMILITGLPAVGKTTVARELAYLLEESNSKRLNGNQPEPGLQEAAWAFFKNYRRGSASSDNSYQPGPSNCHRREHSSPVEYFARRKATVVNVDHFSYMEGMRERHMSGPDSKRLMPPEPLIRTAGEIWWYCMSLASLQSKRQADPESIRRLDRGRRLAIESYVMPESEKESAIILTECLYGDGRNGKSETVAVAYKTAAEVFDRRLIPIYLTCNAHEHQRRFECRQRDAQKNLEGISDPAITYRIPYKDAMVLRQEGLDKVSASIKNRAKANGGSLYYFSKPADYQDGKYSVITEGREFSFEPVDLLHKNQGCRIDTTGLSASEVASIIQRFCEDVMRGMPLQTLKGWESSAPPPEGDGEKDTNGDGKQRKQNRPGNENMFIN